MDARYLSQPDRDTLKRIVCNRRDEIGQLIRRMEARSWFTDDGVLQNLRAAWHSLHAAVQALKETDGQPVKRYEPGPKYPV